MSTNGLGRDWGFLCVARGLEIGIVQHKPQLEFIRGHLSNEEIAAAEVALGLRRGG